MSAITFYYPSHYDWDSEAPNAERVTFTTNPRIGLPYKLNSNQIKIRSGVGGPFRTLQSSLPGRDFLLEWKVGCSLAAGQAVPPRKTQTDWASQRATLQDFLGMEWFLRHIVFLSGRTFEYVAADGDHHLVKYIDDTLSFPEAPIDGQWIGTITLEQVVRTMRTFSGAKSGLAVINYEVGQFVKTGDDGIPGTPAPNPHQLISVPIYNAWSFTGHLPPPGLKGKWIKLRERDDTAYTGVPYDQPYQIVSDADQVWDFGTGARNFRVIAWEGDPVTEVPGGLAPGQVHVDAEILDHP